MVNTILINKNNAINNGFKNSFSYKFVGNGLQLDSNRDNSIALVSLSMPFSIFNISGIYNNNSYQIIYNSVTYTNNIPDSYLDIDGLNKNLQFFLVSNNLYLIDDAGNYRYYMEFVLDVALYKVSVKFYPVPSVLPTGWSNPGGMALTGLSPQLVVSSSNNFYKLLGLIPSTYPASPSAVNAIQLSNTDIELSPISSINLACNLINNSTSVSPQIFYSFVPSNVGFGEYISVTPPELVYVTCNNGFYQDLTISIVDEFNRPIPMQDNSCVFMIAFKSTKKVD